MTGTETIGGWLARRRFALRDALAATPLFLPIARRRPDHRGCVVDETFDVVIEGFPRSGNTFATAAFEVAQPGPVRIARHLHSSAHVRRAVALGIPTVVLIRRPEDAVLSMLVRHPGVAAAQGFDAYARFYRGIRRQRSGFVIATFEEVIEDFGTVIDRVNERFGTSFAPFRTTPEELDATFALVDDMEQRDLGRRAGDPADTSGRPDPGREQKKAALRAEVEGDATRRARHRARRAYQEALETRGVSSGAG